MYLYTEMNHKLDHWDKRYNRVWCPVGQWALEMSVGSTVTTHTRFYVWSVWKQKRKLFCCEEAKTEQEKERGAAPGTQRKKLCQFSVLLSKIKYWLWRRKRAYAWFSEAYGTHQFISILTTPKQIVLVLCLFCVLFVVRVYSSKWYDET